MKRRVETRHWTRRDDGQITIFVVIAMAIFLLGFIGFAVDMTNLWFHRQMAQGAADAACQAGIMNVLVPTATRGFTPPTAFDCSATAPNASSGPTPCRYAALNGYPGGGLVANTPSNSVAVSFPTTVPTGVDPGNLPPTNLAPVNFLRVDIMDRVKLTFATLIPPFRSTQDVHAQAICGLTLSKAPIPLIVLNPTCTHAFEVASSATLKIVGGPTRSVQVNSANQTCAAATAPSGCSSNAIIDLSEGGPNFTGSSFGVFGSPGAAPPNFNGGTTGSWGNASPIADPFAQTLPPTPPGPALANLNIDTGGVPGGYTPSCPTPGFAPCRVPYRAWGCPDTAGCWQYTPGLYTQPIVVKNSTAIFDPGIYYIKPTTYTNANDGLSANYKGTPGNGCVPNQSGQFTADFAVLSNGVVRPSKVTGNGEGTMFYLSGPGTGGTPYGSVAWVGNAGNPGGRTVDPYDTSIITCPGGTPPDPRVNVPAFVNGNVLLGQCTSGGNYLGAGSTDTPGPVRGLLFFQDRDNGSNQTYLKGQPSLQGSGAMLLSGSLYFHNCASPDGPGLGTNCGNPTVGYNAYFQLQGTPGSGTFVLGNITTDELVESGNGSVAMQLDPNRVYFILKATLMR
ncbi:MAG: TadE/TadG family type IV pilus assembly protein [Terriglobia bacterium]